MTKRQTVFLCTCLYVLNTRSSHKSLLPLGDNVSLNPMSIQVCLTASKSIQWFKPGARVRQTIDRTTEKCAAISGIACIAKTIFSNNKALI